MSKGLDSGPLSLLLFSLVPNEGFAGNANVSRGERYRFSELTPPAGVVYRPSTHVEGSCSLPTCVASVRIYRLVGSVCYGVLDSSQVTLNGDEQMED